MLADLLPDVCAGCGRAGSVLCPVCVADLCHAPAAVPPAGVDAWNAAFAYRGPARELVARVKYRNARAAVPWLAAAMVDALGDHPAFEAVTWAPTVAARRRRRGFDPAQLLAGAVADQLGSPVMRLLRRLPGPPQTGLDGAARRVGPRFLAIGPVPARVLLVDDVATTGATLAAAALALRTAGGRSVCAVTAARTPRSR